MHEWARARFGDADSAHIATGAAECAWCPICQLIAALRGDRPDVTDKLSAAAAAVVDVVGSLLNPPPGRTPGPAEDPTRHRAGCGDGRSGEPDRAADRGIEPSPVRWSPTLGRSASTAHRPRPRRRERRGSLTAGRKQHMPLAVGVDIGGTKVAAGVVDDDGQVIDRELRATPGADVAETERVIAEVVQVLAARHPVVAVGIGAAGWIAPTGRPCFSLRTSPGATSPSGMRYRIALAAR